MSNLTEQWKKGELPEGEYYCRTTHDSSVCKYYLSDVDAENMIEIFAPVPSYEKYTKMVALLKECINMSKDGIFVPRYSFIDEIEKILGEK